MTFDEILEQVIALLKRQGRVSYPALKIRFSLDDDYLEALKAEIIEAPQLATDENGKVLVWVGNTEETSVSVSPPAQLTQQPTAQETQPTTEPPPREAERRQLTVMFCDLVDSTKLSSQLDPEDYREVVREYQRVCSEVITRFDGHIAQYLGDGLLVYFGYPVAHEEDAQRAIHTGLGIVAAIQSLNTRLEQTKGIKLAVRLGIHTGHVVVGEMGGAGSQEQLALGETPNVTARIQGLAEPDTVVISEATYRLIQGYFDCQELGEQSLRGVSQPMPVYQVLQESGVQSRLDIASTRGLTPLVGREQEVGLLLERWQQAKDGQGQVILLSGEAGIGKSRLVQVLKEHIADEPHARWECRSSPYYQNSALHPIIDLIQRALRWHQDDTAEAKLGKLEQILSQYRLPLAETIPLFAPLLSLSISEAHYAPLVLSPQRQRQKTLETIVAILLEQAEQQPVLFIVEDLHWTDPTTLEFLDLLLDQSPTASIYTLLTCRPTFEPSWSHRSYLTEITVNRLLRNQIEWVAEHVSGSKTLPPEVLRQIVEKTDGVPLFVEEMTKAVLESGVLKEIDNHYELVTSLTALTIPATLHDSLMARLDRLVTAKAIAQYASVIGRQFSYRLLQALSPLDETTLQRELNRLVEAALLYQHGLPPEATYIFKHALIQDAAYQSLLRSTRQQYHQRVALVLEGQFPGTAETQPEVLAHHYTAAGLNEQAVGYWKQAGQKAIQRSANVEAVHHLTRGLALLGTLPDTPEHTQNELTFLMTLGTPLLVTKGYAAPEVGRVYARARELCEQIGEMPQLLPIMLGLRTFYQVRGDFHTARALGEQGVALAQRIQDHALVSHAHYGLGHTLFSLGAFAQARAHFEQGVAYYDPQRHRSYAFSRGQDPRVFCLVTLAWSLWYLGYPAQALTRVQEAITLAQELSHPPSLEHAFSSAALVYQLRSEVSAARAHIERALAVSREQGFAFREALGTIRLGWALVMQEQAAEGIPRITQGITAYQATGAEAWRHYWLALLADAYGTAGHIEEGLTSLAEALTLVEKNGECFYEAELHRLKGKLLLQQSANNAAEAETCFHHAIVIAQNQSAKSWELRAATSLAKLWQSQGKRQEAYDLLSPVYGWFTEGFDTTDLKDAKALLDELAEEISRDA